MSVNFHSFLPSNTTLFTAERNRNNMDTIKGTLAEMMEILNKRMAGFENQLQNSSNTGNLATEFQSFKSFVMDTFKNLQQQIQILAGTLDRQEMQNRRKMLLFHGLTELKDENTAVSVAEVIKNQLGFSEFTADRVKRCHRMGRVTDNQKTRSILVKFHDVSERDKIWLLKTKLKGSGITISEFLTKSRHDIFMAARRKFGINKCWTREGHVFVIGSDDSRHRIFTQNDLDSIPFEVSSKPIAVSKIGATTQAAKIKRGATNKK